VDRRWGLILVHTKARVTITVKGGNIRVNVTVHTHTNTFRCWAGCNDGKSGDVIDIVRLSTGEDVKEAIKILILDFGLKNPSSKQVKGWSKKRVICEQSNAIQKGLDRKINDTMVVQKNIEKEVMPSLLNIKAVDDLNRFGDLYHVLSQIEY
jgi:plasmid rolling circle replication initiator protein Rep